MGSELKRDIKGNLDKDSLPVILHSLARRSLTGNLLLKREKDEVKLCVEGGHVVYAYTTITYLQPLEFLFEWGFINLKEYEDLKEKKILDFLAFEKEKVFSEKNLRKAVRRNVREIIFDSLQWHRGEYIFSYKKCEEFKKIARLNLYDLLVRGLVREKDWNVVRKILKPYRRVPKFDTGVDPEEMEEIKLTREESYVLRLVNGEKSLEEIIGESKLTDFETGRILYAFILAGVLIF